MDDGDNNRGLIFSFLVLGFMMFGEIKLGMTLFKILGPIVIVIGAIWYHNSAVDNAYDDGVASRDKEVRILTGERDTALTDLMTCRGVKDQALADVTSLNGKLAAQADEAKDGTDTSRYIKSHGNTCA